MYCRYAVLYLKYICRDLQQQTHAFTHWLIIRFLNIFSTYFLYTALAYYLFQKTGNVIDLGNLGLAELMPALGFGLIAGYISDNTDKKKLLLIYIISFLCTSITLLVVLKLLAFESCSKTQFRIIAYSTAFLIGCLKAILSPTSFSILNMLSKQQNLTKRITQSTTTWYLGSILGPLASGFLITKFAITQVIAFVVVLNSISLILSMQLQLEQQGELSASKVPLLQSLREGLQFVFSSKLLLAALSLDMFAVLFGGAESMLPAINKHLLAGNSFSFGWLRSAHGIGSIALTICLTFMPLKKNAGLKLVLCVAGFGMCMALLGTSKIFALSFALLFVGGMLDNVSVIIRQYILQKNTPTELQGRVASVNSIFISSSNELGGFVSGVSASLLGLQTSIVTGGIITIIIAAVVWQTTSSLRRFEMT